MVGLTPHVIVIYILLWATSWIIGWNIIYKLIGIYLGSISINNGVLFNNIIIKTKKVQIHVESFRFRLWGNSRRLIINNLRVFVPESESKPKSKGNKDGGLEQFNMRVFPNNPIVRFILRILVCRIPNMDIELKESELQSNTIVAKVDFARFTLNSRYSMSNSNHLKFNTCFLLNYIEANTNNINSESVFPLLSTASLKFDVKCAINLTDGLVGSVKLRLFVDDPRVLVFKFLKLYVDKTLSLDKTASSSSNTKSKIDKNPPPRPQLSSESEIDNDKHFKRFLKVFNLIYSNIDELSLLVENVHILEIPFITTQYTQSFTNYLESSFPVTSLDLLIKSINVNLLKLSQDSAGFHSLFNSLQDKPLHITNSIQLVTVNYSRISKNEGSISKKSVEILSLPNYSLSFKGNFLDHISRGEPVGNCSTELFITSSSPIMDIDSFVLSSFIYNFVLLKKYSKFRKIYQVYEDILNADFPDESDSDQDVTLVNGDVNLMANSSKKTPIKDRLLNYLYEYYPRLDIKFIIEQPKLIIRYINESNSSIQLLDFSLSSLNFRTLTNKNKNFEPRCQISHPSITYIEKPTNDNPTEMSCKQEILSFSSINLTFDISKDFCVKNNTELHNFKVELFNLDILVGIFTVLTEMTALAEQDLNTGSINLYLNSSISKFQKITPNVEHVQRVALKSLQDKIFHWMPAWMSETGIQLSNIDIRLGSRSVLIPRELLSEIKNYDLDSDFNMENNMRHDLRYLRLQLEGLDISVRNSKVAKFEVPKSGSLSSSSLETLTSSNDSSFWTSSCNLLGLDFSVMADFDKQKFDSFLMIPNLDINLNAETNEEMNNFLNIAIYSEAVIGSIDFYKIFIIIGTIYLARENILNPLKTIKYKLKKDAQSSTGSGAGKVLNKSVSLLDFLLVDFKIKKSDISVVLHDDYKLKLDNYQTKLCFRDSKLSLTNKFSRLLTESPTMEGGWCRLYCADEFLFNFDLNDPKIFNLNTDFLKLIHPHKHVTYKFFDNLSITIKIVKHMFKCLKQDSKHVSIIHPSESFPKLLPTIRLKTNRVVFNMEDDPFESELNMIYQLGKVEQRKRLELNSLFENKVETTRILLENIPDKKEDLEQIISDSWIRKVKSYKRQLNDEITKNRKFLFGNEAKLESKFQKGIQPYSIHAPLLSIIMERFDLTVLAPKFGLDNLTQYLYDIGQGQPLDTRYSLLLPTYVDLGLQELRMHLRDYPLPLLFVPKHYKNPKSNSVNIAGHLIIAEPLITEDYSLRRLKVPLIPNLLQNKISKFYEVEIEKSLASVKLFTDLNIFLNSDSPSRFVWGQSYQFGIQQIMLNFDQFSKPPVDPSPKLGFWDKLRLVMHGKFKIDCGTERLNNGPLEVAFKGSRDPYSLFTVSSGFILSFKDNVIWSINRNDDSREFFDISSEKVSWYIPNYLTTPLISWLRESSDGTLLPKSDKYITSCYGYYLDDESYKSSNYNANMPIVDKRVVSLSGSVNFKVGFVLQRNDTNGEVTEECRPHHEISLFNPIYTQKEHDSYAGFRSDFINMAISLNANFNESYNSIHLTPGVFEQFFSWWKLFSGNMQLPIRKGKMFGELKKSTKFSQHLVSNRFRFNFKSLFISHIYRDDTISPEEGVVESHGLRGKMDDFLVDLKQRKEDRIAVHKELSRNRTIKKMQFYIADLHLNGIDLRIISARFEQNVYNPSSKSSAKDSKYRIFDNDRQWFDMEDYEETYLASILNYKRHVDIKPILYAQRFSYLRDTEPDARFKDIDLFDRSHNEALRLQKDVFNSEKKLVLDRIGQLKDQVRINELKGLSTSKLFKRINILHEDLKTIDHDSSLFFNRERRMLTSNFNAKFHNKFVLIRMLLKWNTHNRNLLLKYLHFVQLKSFLRKYLSYESISALEELIDKNGNILDPDNMSQISNSLKKIKLEKLSQRQNKKYNSQDRLKNFDEILADVDETQDITEDYLIDITSPQIQLQSEEAPESTIIVATPRIDCKILSVYEKTSNRLLLDIDELENRYGILVNDANVLVFSKSQVENTNNFIFDKHCYGSTTSWPPWLGVEICKDGTLAGRDNLLIENASVMITYDQLRSLGTNISRLDDGRSEFTHASSYYDSIPHSSERVSQRLQVDIPKVVISSTASQYFTLYFIITNLLMYTEPSNKLLNEKLEKLKFSIDFQDLASLQNRIKQLHDYYRVMEFMSMNYSFRQDNLDNESLNLYLLLSTQQNDVMNEIYLLMHALLTGNTHDADSSKQPKAEWNINADEIILHMLEDDRTPILDIAMAHGEFRRVVNEDGSNVNKIDISMMQGFNLIPSATYPSFLEPFKTFEDLENLNEHNLITVEWSMYQNVGGIRLIDNFEINSRPLNIRMDEITGEKIMRFLFRSDVSTLEETKIQKGKDEVKKQFKDKHNLSHGDSHSDDNHDEEIDQDNEILISQLSSFKENEEELEGVNESSVRFNEDKGKKQGTTRTNTELNKLGSFYQSSSSFRQEEDEQLEEMVDRSKKFVSVNKFKLNPVPLQVSIKLHKGYRKLLNVQDFHIELPQLVINNKVLSMLEITMLLKKIVINAIMNHLGSLLKNKFTIKRNLPSNTNQRLNQIEHYSNFTRVSELRSDSVSESSKINN